MATGSRRLSGDRGSAIVLEMGCSSDEFARGLPAAMRDWTVGGGSDAWQVSTADGTWVASVRIRPRPERRMGSLRLPVLAVTIELATATADLAKEFMRRFERGFHRGGG